MYLIQLLKRTLFCMPLLSKNVCYENFSGDHQIRKQCDRLLSSRWSQGGVVSEHKNMWETGFLVLALLIKDRMHLIL